MKLLEILDNIDGKKFKVFLTIVISSVCIALPFIILHCVNEHDNNKKENNYYCENSMSLMITRIITFFVIFYSIIKAIFKDNLANAFSFLEWLGFERENINNFTSGLQKRVSDIEKIVVTSFEAIPKYLIGPDQADLKKYYIIFCIAIILITGIIFSILSFINKNPTNLNLVNLIILIILIIFINYSFDRLLKIITISIFFIPLFFYTTGCINYINNIANIFTLAIYVIFIGYFCVMLYRAISVSKILSPSTPFIGGSNDRVARRQALSRIRRK